MQIAKLSRSKKAELTKQRLFRAAIDAIARHGFESASVARITAHAKVSTGTFYNYFETREALLQQVILSLGYDLRHSISAVLPEECDFFTREELSFRQYFRFIKRNPSYIRLLNEAETFLPAAYEELWSQILDGYRRVLKDASKNGDIRTLGSLEIEGVALFLMSARHYYGQTFLHLCDSDGNLPEEIVSIYLRFIRGALGTATVSRRPSPRALQMQTRSATRGVVRKGAR